MPKKKKIRKEKAKLKKLREQELEILRNLKLDHPDLYRLCENKPCCQAKTLDGKRCSRPAMTTRTYIKKFKCCMLCYQHALLYGVYGLLKVGQMAVDADYSMDEYCAYHPDECLEYFEKQEKY